MKIFGFEIRKFEKNTTTLEIIETWCVRWESLYRNNINYGVPKINVQGFMTKEGAEEYAKELKDARRLLGDNGWDVQVYKQETPTNK
jgi:hypothetical protein